MTVQELIDDALLELTVLGAGETSSSEDSELGLRRLNRLLDTWNADRRAVYADQISSHTLTPSLQPHTIGTSTPTFSVTQRPVSIEAAHLVVSGAVYGINIRDSTWWAGLTDPTLTGEIPTDLYYAPGWPNGSLYLWPIPTAAHTLELLSRIILSSVTAVTTFTMPPGYESAVVLSLAEMLATPFQVPPPPDLKQRARDARALIFGNNDPDPHMVVADVGLGSRSSFDYRIGR